EQLLSGTATTAGAPQPPRRPSVVPEARRPEVTTARAPQISPFAADSARKGAPKAEFSENAVASGPRLVSGTTSAPNVVMGSAAPAAVLEQSPIPEAPAPELPEAAPVSTAGNVEGVRNIVLEALSNGGQRMLASMLEIGEWTVEGNELVIKVAASANIIDMSLGSDAKRLIIAKASEVMGRTLRLSMA